MAIEPCLKGSMKARDRPADQGVLLRIRSYALG